MDRQIEELRHMLQGFKRKYDAFYKHYQNYEPNGDVSHIWANLQSATDMIDDVLEDFGED